MDTKSENKTLRLWWGLDFHDEERESLIYVESFEKGVTLVTEGFTGLLIHLT